MSGVDKDRSRKQETLVEASPSPGNKRNFLGKKGVPARVDRDGTAERRSSREKDTAACEEELGSKEACKKQGAEKIKVEIPPCARIRRRGGIQRRATANNL